MLTRRRAMVLGSAGAAVLMSGRNVFAASEGEMQDAVRKLAGKIFYTSTTPGRWASKVKGHVPKVSVHKSGSDVLVRAVTFHGMSDKHFIVKHVLLDKDLNFIAEKLFDRRKDDPMSDFTLNGYSGRLYVLSNCNIHDNWIEVATA